MKRKGNLYSEFISKEHWELAYKNALRGKVSKYCVQRVLAKGKEYLEQIRQEVINHTFEFKGYVEHTIYEPKERKIYVARIPERIYHWACMIIIERIFEPTFIIDSYSCRKKKGQHKCSKKCAKIVKRNKYCLKLDISKFYPSINHEILKDCLRKKIKDKQFLEANFAIIDSHNKETETGIPIGNYSSQIYGNIYMTKMDMFVKHILKCKDYLRYCDDFCLFSNNKEYLNWCKQKIIKFVTNDLKMKLSKCDLFKTSQGVDFVGYRHFPKYILIRKRTAKKIKRRCKRLAFKLTQPVGFKEAERMMGQAASSYGWSKHANSFNFLNKTNLENLLKEVKMKFTEIRKNLPYYKSRNMKIQDFIDKTFEIYKWEYSKLDQDPEKKSIKLTVKYNGEKKVFATKAAVIIRDLEEILAYQRESGVKCFPLEVTLRQNKEKRYFYFEEEPEENKEK